MLWLTAGKVSAWDKTEPFSLLPTPLFQTDLSLEATKKPIMFTIY